MFIALVVLNRLTLCLFGKSKYVSSLADSVYSGYSQETAASAVASGRCTNAMMVWTQASTFRPPA